MPPGGGLWQPVATDWMPYRRVCSETSRPGGRWPAGLAGLASLAGLAGLARLAGLAGLGGLACLAGLARLAGWPGWLQLGGLLLAGWLLEAVDGVHLTRSTLQEVGG